jgi:hypothetical protein
VFDHEPCEFGEEDILKFIDLILKFFFGEFIAVDVVLQDLIPVELREVTAEAHQYLIQQQQLLEIFALLVFHDVIENGTQPQQVEAIQILS